MNREDAIRKAAALLRLAARAGTPAEAAAAAGRAQEIVDKYELTADVIEAGDAEAAPDEPIVSGYEAPGGWLDNFARIPAWRWSLAATLSRLHGCHVFTTWRGDRMAGQRTIEIVGRPGQMETVRYLYRWLAGEIERLTEASGRGLGVTWRREFAEGAASEVGKILRAKRAATVATVREEGAGDSRALVRIERGLARLDPAAAKSWATVKYHLRSSGGGGGGRAYDKGARDAGRAAAHSIDFSPARASIGGPAPKMIGGAR